MPYIDLFTFRRIVIGTFVADVSRSCCSGNGVSLAATRGAALLVAEGDNATKPVWNLLRSCRYPIDGVSLGVMRNFAAL